MKAQTAKTVQQIRDEFLQEGITVASWADQHGFNRATVNQVLTGRNAATYGVGHLIAVALGLKLLPDGNGREYGPMEIIGEGRNRESIKIHGAAQ